MAGLFDRDCVFVAGSTAESNWPKAFLPEVVFIGRSNVGKSSLLNALVKRKSLARTSSKPGHTRQFNFFRLDEKLHLVDVPGYGYARISKDEQYNWKKHLQAYVTKRRTLKRVYLLIDSRHPPKESDKELIIWLNAVGISTCIVLTKADKAKKSALTEHVEQVNEIIANHGILYPEAIITSADKKEGIDALRHNIKDVMK